MFVPLSSNHVPEAAMDNLKLRGSSSRRPRSQVLNLMGSILLSGPALVRGFGALNDWSDHH